jgi:tRNA threonylcarbamoyladenosine biosynthesis protein TsaE
VTASLLASEFSLPGPDDTDRLGRWLADTLPPRAVVYLRGDLGAGKSTLARALLQRLGVTGPIKSPTYTLVERYPLPEGEAAHLDLYRIAAAGELDFLGLDDMAAQARLWLVEWPERGAGSLPAADLEIGLAIDGAGRSARIAGMSPVGSAWLTEVSKVAVRSGSA